MSDSSDYDDNGDDDDNTDAKDNTCYSGSAGNGGGNSTGTGGGSAEWMRFLSPSALSETLGAMAKAKASSSTNSRKTQSWEKVKINSTEGKGCKDARKELVKHIRKKIGVFLRVKQPQLLGRLCHI